MLEKLKLENILPHKAPMILLNKVKDYSLEETHRWIETEVNITSKTLFFDPKKKFLYSYLIFLGSNIWHNQ